MGHIGNKGKQLIDFLHNEGLLKDGMTVEEIEVIAKPFMLDEKWLMNVFWEDVFYRAEELGYKFSC